MRAAGRRKLDAPTRRETILAAALPEFASAAYGRTRVADIAAKVGVTEPVVFQNFGTKADLFAAVLARAADEVATHLQALGSRSATALDALSSLLAHQHQDQMHSKGALGAIFVEAAGNPLPSIHDAAHRAHERTVQALAGLIGRGQDEGSIRKDVEATALGGLLLPQIHARQFRRPTAETSPLLERDLRDAILQVLSP